MSDHHPHKETPDADSAAAAVQGDRVEQPAPHSPEPDGDFAAHVEPTDEGAQLQLAAELQHLLKERGFEVGAASELGGVPQQVLAAIVQALGATRVSNANSRGDDESSGGAQDDLGETNPSNEDLQRSVYRQALTDRIARSRKLPKGLRGRLAEAAEAVQLSQDGDEEPSLRLSDAVTLIEDTLPDHIALSADGARQTDHPSGEGFFTGDTTQMSDEEAERIAQEQLKNSGFLARRPDH